MKKIVVLSGAGMSAESGVSTFRDAGGLWEGHDIMEVASPEGWKNNRKLVLEFYNARRRQLKEVNPNEGHLLLAEMEKHFNVQIITQNVDNLHERAGSSKVLHLHGELTKVRSERNSSIVLDWTEDIHEGDVAEDGAQLRPHIVWFGEMVPNLEKAASIITQADAVIIVGTSMQVYPAASLYMYAPDQCPIYYIDPRPAEISSYTHQIHVIADMASTGLKIVFDKLLNPLA